MKKCVPPPRVWHDRAGLGFPDMTGELGFDDGRLLRIIYRQPGNSIGGLDSLALYGDHLLEAVVQPRAPRSDITLKPIPNRHNQPAYGFWAKGDDPRVPSSQRKPAKNNKVTPTDMSEYLEEASRLSRRIDGRGLYGEDGVLFSFMMAEAEGAIKPLGEQRIIYIGRPERFKDRIL